MSEQGWGGEGREPCGDCHHQHGPHGCYGQPSPSDLWAGVTPAVCDCPEWTLYRPRVAFTHGSIAKVVTARRRYVCGNHLSGVEKHYIEVGQRHVSNSLPPHNSEIGNENWWYLRVCLDCCPIKHDERTTPPADTRNADGAGS